MAAYVIAEAEALDVAQAQRYGELATATILRHGGRYLVRGADPEVPEGDRLAGRRVFVIEFPDMERLLAWYNSPEYAEALAIARTALKRRLVFVDGVDG